MKCAGQQLELSPPSPHIPPLSLSSCYSHPLQSLSPVPVPLTPPLEDLAHDTPPVSVLAQIIFSTHLYTSHMNTYSYMLCWRVMGIFSKCMQWLVKEAIKCSRNRGHFCTTLPPHSLCTITLSVLLQRGTQKSLLIQTFVSIF